MKRADNYIDIIGKMTYNAIMKIKCIGCGVEKDSTEYHADKTYKNGVKHKCKKCCIKYSKDWMKNNPGKARISRIRWLRKTAHKRVGIYQKKKAMYYAHSAVKWGIKTGRIKRMPCEICGADKNVHAHHDDYAKPLVFRWMCAKHHFEYHIKRSNP